MRCPKCGEYIIDEGKTGAVEKFVDLLFEKVLVKENRIR
jgi:hypothetical protein